ncbi:MAG: polyphosphate polymerase domain-containing protein [Phycisphaerales bacterium]|nr:polyphosphate polymerase domain-containing protein [Phycisphaerales bacterium]
MREYARAYLEPDCHSALGPERGYSIQSLYLDSADWALCRASQDGLRNRFKLRVRWYHAAPMLAFFEVKRRVDKAVIKRRAAVDIDHVDTLLEGRWPRAQAVAHDDVQGRAAIDLFNDLAHSVNARPRLTVSYRREAYIMPDKPSTRLTFDRDLATWPHRGAIVHERPPAAFAFHPRIGGVIVEIKFTDRFPEWMKEMVQTFGLARQRVPKYVICAQALRSHDFALSQHARAV